jgi:hypothetical protein
MVRRGKDLSSRIVGNRPSIPSPCSPAPLPQPTLGDLFGVPFCPRTLTGFCIKPSCATNFPSSVILASICPCTSMTARRFGTFSRSLRSCIISSRRFRFSDRRRDTSASKQRMRTDWVELFLWRGLSVCTQSTHLMVEIILCKLAILSDKASLHCTMISIKFISFRDRGKYVRASTDSVGMPASFKRAICGLGSGVFMLSLNCCLGGVSMIDAVDARCRGRWCGECKEVVVVVVMMDELASQKTITDSRIG